MKVAEALAVSPSAANPDYTKFQRPEFLQTWCIHHCLFVWQMRSRIVTREGSFWEEGHCKSSSKNEEGEEAILELLHASSAPVRSVSLFFPAQLDCLL